MSFRWAGWLGLLIAAAGMASAGAPAGATFPGANGKIAFVRYIEGGTHIFVMNADGSGVTRLTESPGYAGSPAWSPDGTKIAFARTPVEGATTDPGDIYVMNADGSGLMNLTSDPAGDGEPTWSPDGTRIAFSSNRIAGDYPEVTEIFIMGSDGSGVRQLTHGPPPSSRGPYLSFAPSWSPDGRRIAFVRATQTTPSDICLVSVEGGGEANLTTDPGWDTSPDWSPDGSKIIFQRQGEGEAGFRIHSMDADGSNVRSLTTDPHNEPRPVWSPDGTMIAFVAGGPPVTTPGIWVMRADGTGRDNLSDLQTSEGDPAWQPLRGPQARTSPSPAGGTAPAPAPSASGCVPVLPKGWTTFPTPADEIPVLGGSPGANDPDFSYGRIALILAGLILIAAAFVALRAGRRL